MNIFCKFFLHYVSSSQFFYKNNIEKKEKMLIEWVMNLIDMYVVVEEQDKNTYIEFKNRAKKIKNIIDLSYQDIYEIKTLLKIYLLKHNILFPLYMKGKFKILKKGMLFFHE